MDIISIFISIIILSVIIIFAITFLAASNKKNNLKSKKIRNKDRTQILKTANRRLAQNPKDIPAHISLGELFYTEQVWDKAFKAYDFLRESSASHSEINMFEVNKRYALSAIQLNKYDEAYQGLLFAHSSNQLDFEVNYNLGFLEFKRKQYEKAIFHLRAAYRQNSEHAPTLKHLGLSFFKVKNYKEALNALKRCLDFQPDDKESLFAMAESFYELGQNEQALRLFSHLRTDPAFGPSASLFAGTIRLNLRQFQQAVADFEIGLKHENIKVEVVLEIKYRLAIAYLREQEISKAVSLLHEIQQISPSYKDTAALLEKYKELNSSRNLQVYLLASTSDFMALCRKLVVLFFPKAKIKVTNIAMQKSDWADILVEVETSRWSDVVLFRMIRSAGTTGEIVLRDFHAMIKELKAGRGYCITSGVFSDEAKKFVEARLIDLIEKDRLIKLLNTVDSKEKGLLIQD